MHPTPWTGTAVEIGDRPLTIDAIVAVADGAEVALTAGAVERIVASRQVVDALVGGEELIYGLNTGLGNLRDVRVPVDVLREYQRAIVVSHAGGIGSPLPGRVVRAAMLARLAGIAAGGSGGSLAMAQQMAGLLNRGVTPVVPEVGSVGASDLMHMAAIAEVLIGEGSAEVEGERLPGAEALARVGLEPIVMEPKDGLASVSANGVAIGHAALVAARARWLARAADVVFSVSLEATAGNPSIVDPAVARAKGIAGQTESARRIHALIAGSDRCVAGSAKSVQDPLSFRVTPQVHGAYRLAVDQLAWATETELNARTDNPLVVAAERRIVSNGNFAPMVLALAADAIRPAVAHVGQISDRRSGHLFDTLAADERIATPEVLIGSAEAAPLMLRYASAARAAELRALADPVSLDIPVLDLGVEDHATNAPLTVRRSDDALDLLTDILVIELLIARPEVRLLGDVGQVGGGTGAGLEALDASLAALGDRPPVESMRSATRDALASIVDAAEAAAGIASEPAPRV
jgi:histidine ammonia-lyase